MESNFSNRDFEQFVKQNADQYRMFPSERVWKEVNNALHTKRKWYGLWLSILLLLTGGAVTWVMIAYPTSKKQNQANLENKILSAKTKLSATPAAESQSQEIESLLTFNKEPFTVQNSTVIQEDLSVTGFSLSSTPDDITLDLPSHARNFSDFSADKKYSPVVENLATGNTSIQTELNTATTDEKLIGETEKYPAASNVEQPRLNNSTVFYPFTIESVINSYRYKKLPRRISWQLFVTPTVSYRKLSVNKSYDGASAGVYPFASLSSDVNSAVTHKPDLGMQIGLSAGYPIAKNLKLRGGLQFNINRYDIKAYQFNGEVATIDLNGGPGNNTISTWTYYRNYSGYKSDWLKNYYFSVSVPVGAEVKLFGNTKTNVGIAGTLQPTYILNDRAYLISTDYKNYAEVPRLIRHVNLNTSFETFVNYTNGKTKWQIGPQVRYQVLSSFQNKYPVKENLFDFGLKVWNNT